MSKVYPLGSAVLPQLRERYLVNNTQLLRAAVGDNSHCVCVAIDPAQLHNRLTLDGDPDAELEYLVKFPI